MSEESAETPNQAFARQLRTARKQREWLQDDLADRLTSDLGHPMSRVTLAKIETGKREVSLNEALTLSLAVGVAPIHLFIPRRWGTWREVGREMPPDSTPSAMVKIANKTLRARTAAEWVRGAQPVAASEGDKAFEDMELYTFFVSDYEKALYRDSALMHLRNNHQVLANHVLTNDPEAALRSVADMRATLDRLEAELQQKKEGGK